ncbi:MAG TPA: hypothetical protein VMH32_12190 [Burkholderiales bacterium]|nr:hypothetical protein [Burkholderiales bacterium]
MRTHYRLVRLPWAAFLLIACVQPGSTANAQDKPASDAVAAQPARHAPSKDRVFVWDLDGTWISKSYLDALKRLRAPHAAAKNTQAVVIQIDKHDDSHPILISNLRHSVQQFLIEVEPDLKPGSYRMVTAPQDGVVSASEVTYIYFHGVRTSEGKFEALSIAEPHFANRKYLAFVRLPDPLKTVVNRLVIAGQYVDAQGRRYEFAESGEAILPDRKFTYEISLDPSRARCELLQSRDEREPDSTQRIGFQWHGHELCLFDVKPDAKGAPTCTQKPFAVLTPA